MNFLKNSKSQLFLFLLGIFSPNSFAQIFTSSNVTVEVLEARSSGELAQISEHIRETLSEHRAEKKLEALIIESGLPNEERSLESENGIAHVISSLDLKEENISHKKLSPEFYSEVNKTSEYWWKKNAYRITFTIVRVVLNGGIFGWSLLASTDVSPTLALGAGVIMGTISGSLQWWSHQFAKFIADSSISKKLGIENPGKLIQTIESTSKWFGIEVIFVGTAKLLLIASGQPSHGFTNEFLDTLLISAKGMAAQGSWDVSISQNSLAKLKSHHKDRKKIEFQRDLAFLAASTATTLSSILLLLGKSQSSLAEFYSTAGNIGIAAITFGGLINYARSILKKPSPTNCQKHLAL